MIWCLESINPLLILENYASVSKLKNGDLVFIELFIDVHNIFVRKVEDKTDEFLNFIEYVHSYCSAGTY